MDNINFLKGLEFDYNTMPSKDNNSVYITTDTNKGFLGDKRLWATPEENTVYGINSYDFSGSHHYVDSNDVIISKKIGLWETPISIAVSKISENHIELRNKNINLSAAHDIDNDDPRPTVVEISKESIIGSVNTGDEWEGLKKIGLSIDSNDVINNDERLFDTGIEIGEKINISYLKHPWGGGNKMGVSITPIYNAFKNSISSGIEISEGIVNIFSRINGETRMGITIIEDFNDTKIRISATNLQANSFLFLNEESVLESKTIDDLKIMLGL